jgi:capsid protein
VPQAYHVSDRIPAPPRRRLKWERVPARDRDGRPPVLHLFDRLRPEQTRGVPYLAPVIEHLKQLGDYSDAEVTAAVVSAMFTLASRRRGRRTAPSRRSSAKRTTRSRPTRSSSAMAR